MAKLNEAPGWVDVTQLETTDRVVGGAGGKSNMQAQELVNRTALLKSIICDRKNPRGEWVTGAVYSASGVGGARDTFTRGGVAYVVVVDHTSGVFADDLAAGRVFENDAAQLGVDLGATDGASRIGYVAVGVGAVPTHQAEINSRYVDVFDYMTPLQISDAKRITSTGSDHTASINACIAANKHVNAGPWRFKLTGPINIVGSVSSPSLPKIHGGKTFRMSPETRLMPSVDAEVLIVTGSSNTITGGIIDCSDIGSLYTKSAILVTSTSPASQNSYNNISCKVVNYGNKKGTALGLSVSGGGYIYYNVINLHVEGFYFGIHGAASGSNEINANTFNCNINSSQQTVNFKGNGNHFNGVYQATYADPINPELACVYIDGHDNNLGAYIYDVGNSGLVKYGYEFAAGSINNIIPLSSYVKPTGYIHSSNIMIGQGISQKYGRAVQNRKIVLPMFGSHRLFSDYNEQKTLPDVERFHLISPINNILANPSNVTSIVANTSGTAENTVNYSTGSIGKKVLNHNYRSYFSWYKAVSISGGYVEFDITLPLATQISTIGMVQDVQRSGKCTVQAFVYTTDIGDWTELPPIFPSQSGTSSTAYGSDVLFDLMPTLTYVSARLVTGIRFRVTVPSRASGTVSDYGYMPTLNYIYACTGSDAAISPKSNASGYPWIGGDNFAGDIGFTSNSFGPVITAPNNSKWRLVVSNSGVLSAVAL